MRAFLSSTRLSGILLLASCALFGCDTSTLPEGAVSFLTGPGDDPWSGDPAAKHVLVELVQGTTRTTLADVSAPPDTFSIGNGGPSDVVAHFEATGLTSAGDAVVFGASIPFYVQGFAGAYVPLFVGRKGGFTTAPTALLSAHTRPLSAIGSQSFLLVAGSEDAAFDVYDAGTWSVPSNVTPLPQTVKSMAISGTLLLMINDDSAGWLDLATGLKTNATPPAGLTFADISGGQTLIASDGTIYIVGATRTDGDATNKVLEIDPAGTLHSLLLKTPRLAAAATLVEDALLVAAGNADGPGAELHAAGGDGFSAIDLPPDATSGAALVELDSSTALLVGGHDASGAPSSTRSIDLGCASACAATEIPSAMLSLSRSSAFRLATNTTLVVGETDDEQTHAYQYDTSGSEPAFVEQPFGTPRARASATVLPNGQLAIFGGTDVSTGSAALTLDVFFP
jgi:hypothetical protein